MSTSLRILVLEDSPTDTELILREMKRAGLVPEWARVDNEKDYLQHLHTCPDLILSDYQMPQFDGLRALELLKQQGFDIPFILISGTIGEDTAVQAMKLGATDYLLKDRLTRLGSAIQHALDESRLRKERKAATETLRLRESALDSVSQGVVITDENRDIIYTNSGFTKLTGYDGTEILGRNCSFLQGADTDPEIILNMRAALKNEDPFDGEILNYRKDGQPFWNDLSISPLRSEEGGPLRFIGIQRDVTERKQAEEALRQSEERFAGAFEHAPIGIALVSLEGRWVKVNRALCDTIGFSEGDLHTRTFQEVTHPDDLESDLELLRRLSAGEITSYQMEKSYIHSDGHFVPVLLNVSLVRDTEGRPQYFISQIQDMTERKKSEQELLRKTAVLEAQVSSSLDAIFVVDQSGQVTLQNQRAVELFKIPEDVADGSVAEMQARWIEDMTKNPQEFLKNVLYFYAHPEEIGHDEIELKDGTTLDRHTFPVIGRDGEYYGRTWAFRDITHRKQDEEILRLTAERLQLAAQAGRIGIWEYDCHSRLLTWDDQMFSLYGQAKEGSNVASERWAGSIHPEDRKRAELELEEALQNDDKPFDTEFRIIRQADGATRFIRAIASLLRDESGKAWRMIGTNWDVTDARNREQTLALALAQEKELSEKARAGDRAKGEFLAVMSHELRTPLNGILGFAELLTKSCHLSAESLDYAQTIASSGESLLRILNDVLDFSHLEAGNVNIEKAQFSPTEILADIRTLLAQQAKEKGLVFETLICENAPDCMEGDSGRLRQIILNLVGNAIKFTERGSLTIGYRPAQARGKVEYFVRDTGSGITPSQIERIFEPFTQADSSISRRHGGSGLGLTISRRLAELMGGSLNVTSQYGQGSEFLVTLPIGDVVTPPVVVTAEKVFDTSFSVEHPLQILVVEDDKVNLKLMHNLLRRLGYSPLAAQSGAEALEIMQRQSPDCVLMDLQMPDMDGIEATAKIRASEKASAVARPAFISALTANVVPIDRQRCLDAGMNGYLNKPIKMAALAAMLEEAVAASRGDV